MDKTANVGLNLPEKGLRDWDVPVNENFNLLDTLIAALMAESAKLAGNNTFTGTNAFKSLIMAATSASEGGEITLDKPSNSTLKSSIKLDCNTDAFRIFATNASGTTVVPLQVDFNNNRVVIPTPAAGSNDSSVVNAAWVNTRLGGTGVTSTELSYLDGVTSNIQTQLNGKAATISGGASTIATNNLTANRALISNGSGKVEVSSVTSTQLGYLSGVTSAIQTQMNGKVPNPSGSNTSWKITCSNNFKIQGGIITAQTSNNYAVTFSTAFTNRPTIITTYLSTQGRGYEGLLANSNTGFTVSVTSASGNYQNNGNGVAWVAFGV